MRTFLPRRPAPALLALVLAITLHAAAATPAPGPALRLRISALEGGSSTLADNQALVQLGALSAVPGRSRKAAIVRRQRVAIRLDGSATHARLSVALGTEAPGCVIRVDGQPVSTIPRLIDPAHRVGATVVHEVEITFDSEAPAGAFLSNLQWVAETD